MTDKAKKNISTVVNILLTIFLVFAVIVTIYATIQATSKSSNDVPSVGGKVFLNVQSNSMKGDGKDNFSEGSIIFAEKISQEKILEQIKANDVDIIIKKGDVITFKYDINKDGTIEAGELNTHRVISEFIKDPVRTYFCYTHGDNNEVIYKGSEEIVKYIPDTIENVDIAKSFARGLIEKVALEDIQAIRTGTTELKGAGTFMNFMTSSTGFLCLIVLPLFLFFAFELFSVVKLVKVARGKKTITAKDEEEIKRLAVEEYLKMQQQSANANVNAESNTSNANQEVIEEKNKTEKDGE